MQNKNELQNYNQEQHQIGSLSSRGPQDEAFITSIALPAAVSTAVYTPSLNLVQVGSMAEHYWVQVDVPTIGTILGTTYTLTVELQSATDNATFARIPELSDITITGDAATPSQTKVQLPPGCAQYVRAAFTTGATLAGSATLAAYTGYLSLRF